MQAAAARGVLSLVGSAPLGAVLSAARLTAAVAYLLWPRRRRIAAENIRLAGVGANQAEARALARASFAAFATMVAES
ncbi:MAG TPA: hypothetical protein VKE22_16950, partial [Haliangiales bacterium]|nr:hypothetical protein [Haliangiales bacterium]